MNIQVNTGNAVVTATIISKGDKIKFSALSNSVLDRKAIANIQQLLGYDELYGTGLGLKETVLAPNKYGYAWYCSGNND